MLALYEHHHFLWLSPEPAAGSFRKRKSCRPADGFIKPISDIRHKKIYRTHSVRLVNASQNRKGFALPFTVFIRDSEDRKCVVHTAFTPAMYNTLVRTPSRHPIMVSVVWLFRCWFWLLGGLGSDFVATCLLLVLWWYYLYPLTTSYRVCGISNNKTRSVE